jgi:outer membrane receptor protein involved in Fe transport
MKKLLLPTLLLLGQLTYAQKQEISGKLIDAKTKVAVQGATVELGDKSGIDISDEQGVFSLEIKGNLAEMVSISALGYEKLQIKAADINKGQLFILQPAAMQLQDVVIAGYAGNPYKAISETDIRMRGVSNSQEVLRLVPGLFIGQHQGGGKAEQIFLRGFDNDHGTDISLQVDGMPINMVSHAHGQGYSDSHFIIPETIGNTTFKKGSADAEKGNLVTSGFAEFHTLNALEQNLFKVEAGQFNTYRALGMVNLLGKDALEKNHSWYAAGEYRYSDSYFEHTQNFKRTNFFTKYYGKISDNSTLSASASTFYSDWKASGQIPDYAVNDGTIGFFGALDPNEGGVTSRTNFNAILLTTTPGNNLIKNQLLYSRYALDLHTNFTFFLEDPVNGDEIRQREGRDLFGYHGSYTQDDYFGKLKLTSQVGLDVRLDATQNSELSHTRNNTILLDPIKLGDITELNSGLFLSETLRFNEKFSLNAGLRFDQFYYRYYNKLDEDPTLNGAGNYKAQNNIISPKFSFFYQPTASTQFYVTAGKGFHSNDTRAVVAADGLKTLPAAYTTDLGTVLKVSDKLLFNAALWQIHLDNEYVYSGDGGSLEFSGKTQRVGFDFSARYQPLPAIYLDADLNYAHGRSVDDPEGENYIPLAPIWSSSAGITYMNKTGFNGSLRYRYLGDRPANEDYSLTADGYFITDLVLNYTTKRYEVGITVNNLFDVRWKETQFETLTKLQNRDAVNSIAFTPGTKFAALAHFSFFF